MSIKTTKINIPKYPKLILKTLKTCGFDGYIVGGCVRDSLLLKKPSDYDVTTNAKPDDIKRIFRKTIDTGIKHGTVSVLFYDYGKPMIYEVTTYRIDGDYTDSRHPNNVIFVDNLYEDLKRRDFTINAMAYNDEVGLIDRFGGIKDLENKIVRAVGDPKERFKEDALRLLRAIRFAAKLGFKLDKETEEAMPEFSKNLSLISKERIQIELTKIITSKNPSYVKYIFDYGFDKYICEDFDKIKIGRFSSNSPLYIAYACLLYNTDYEIAKNILHCLKLDNNNITKILSLLEAKTIYDDIIESDSAEFNIKIKELINFLTYDLVYDFISLQHINNNKDHLIIDKINKLIKQYEKQKTPIFIKDLMINGNDLMDIGFKGVEIGYVLNKLKGIIHKNSAYNEKKLLQDICKKVYNIYKA